MKNILLWPFRKVADLIMQLINWVIGSLNYEYDLKREDLKERTKGLCFQNIRELTPGEKEAIYKYNVINDNLSNEFAKYVGGANG